MQSIKIWMEKYFIWSPLNITVPDIVEILILACVVYNIILWFKRTQAWTLLKGIIVLIGIYALASLFQLHSITFLFERSMDAFLMAVIVVFQPELRRALEQLGKRNIFSGLISFDDSKDRGERFSDDTVDAIIRATFELGRAKTGALIVIEQEVLLEEYINTGIILNAEVTAPLLVQIFEHNTPLHDGAVVVRGNKIIAATCYLPLSNNMNISKELGTRHRAGLGISEVTDSVTIIASEETGDVSLAVGGELFRNIDSDKLRAKLLFMQKNTYDIKRFRLWKGKQKDER
ncbi:MAG: diadenylate cyclase CdaA [Candidatus Fimimorpha sp.]